MRQPTRPLARPLDCRLITDNGNYISTHSHIIKNVADPLSNQDVATKNYVDKNAITAACSVMTGDIKLNVDSDLVRCLG